MKDHRSKVEIVLLWVHYSVIIFTSFSAILLGFQYSRNGFDMVRLVAGVLAADAVLFAAMEGLRHGCFTGWQKMLAKVFYIVAFVDVCAAIFAEANQAFATTYLHYVLPISAPFMGFVAFILLASFLDTRIKNKQNGYALELEFLESRGVAEQQRLILKRERAERRAANRLNRKYSKILNSSLDGVDLSAEAALGAGRVRRLLSLPVVSGSGDGSAASGSVEVKPAGKA